jgi:GT2 family glycosyltransferase
MMHSRLTTLDLLPVALPGVRRGTESRTAAPETRRIDVSVCIPNWNCKSYLRACLESLREVSQGVRLQIIVVDNASSDGADAMVERDFPEVELIRNAENVGFARASNQAAKAAKGSYLLFLNNDTEVPPGALRQLLDFAEENPQIGMIGPKLIDPNGELQISYRNQPSIAALLHRTMLFRWTGVLRGSYYRYRRDSFDGQQTREVEVLMGAALFIRRDRFEACGCWDEEFRFGGEDIELSIRIARKHPLVFYPEAEIVHHGRISSRQNIGFAASNVTIGYAHYFRKVGFSRASILGYKIAVTLDAPLHLGCKVVQYLYRKLRGQTKKAEKSALVVRGMWRFVTRDLLRFWRT